MRYWKTSILWICLTSWHLAYFGGGEWKCEHAWGSVASNNSIKELPSPFPGQFSVHISCPLRKGSLEGHRCSTLCKRGLGKRTEMWSCQDNLPASGGEWAAVSRCARPSSLSAGKPLQKPVLFSQMSLRGSHAAGTSTGLPREGKILRLCLKCVREIEKSVWEIE